MTSVPLFVNGEGMRGGSVHHSIAEHPFIGPARTAPIYRFYSVGDRFPALWPVDEGGTSVVGELYDVPLDTLLLHEGEKSPVAAALAIQDAQRQTRTGANVADGPRHAAKGGR